MNRKGFTLIELLGVIVILAVITTTAGISYVSIKKKNETRQCNEIKENLENAAVDYAMDHNMAHDKTSDSISITTLKDNGYITNDSMPESFAEKFLDNTIITINIDAQRNYSASMNGVTCP